MLGFSSVGESAVAAAAPAPYTFTEPFDSGSSPWSFDTFNGTAGVLTLDTTNQLHGAGCLDVNTTLNAGRLRINAANLPLSGKLFAKFYLYVVAAPSGTSILFKHSAPSGANLMQIGYGAGLGLALRDNAGAFASSHTLTTGSWYRVEAMHDMDASKIQMRVWNSPESTGAADFDSGLVASSGTPDLLTLGQDSSVTSHHRIDSFQLSTVDWIGPDASNATNAPAAEATGTGTANDAKVLVTTAPAEATATGTANDAVTDSTSFITGGNTGNSTGPSVTFPSTIVSGQVVTLMLMLNNTDNITASPTELTTLDSAALSGSGQGTSYLYRMVADGTTASSTLSWTLAATRNWSIAYVAHSDVDQDPSNPYVGFNSASDVVTATTSFTAPSATSTDTGYALEFMGVKGNGTAIGLFTEPSGWTKRQQVLNSNTFGSNIAVATRNGNPVAAGTYGADVWSTDVSATTSFRYTIILPKAPGTAAATGDGTAYDASVSVVALATEATATGTAAWDAGDTVDSIAVGDNPITATGTAYDATVSTAVTTTATPTEAAATGAANDAVALVTPNATEATAAGTAADAAAKVTPNATEATGTGTANDAAAAVTPAAVEATGAGTAADAVAALTAFPAEATSTGAANDATVSTSSSGSATPAEAAATGTANDATTTSTGTAFPVEATGTGSALDATTTSSGTATAVEATGSGSALDATVSTTANGTATPTTAAAVGAAFDAIIAISFTPAEASALAAAADALVRLVVNAAEATGTGEAGSAASVPAGRAEGAPGASPGAGGGSPAVALLDAPRPAAPHVETSEPTTPRAGG